MYGRSCQYQRKFKLEEEFYYIRNIGEGGYGCVSLVRSKQNKKTLCAIKAISKRMVNSKNDAIMLKREKEILEQVTFPFIMSMLGTSKDKDSFYLILEYVRGCTFDKVLYELDILTPDQIKFYMANITIILDYLHQRGVIYRDLKPENLVCDDEGYLKMIDFGTAKLLSKVDTMDEEENLDRTFTVIGTPHYMAPEVLKENGYSYSCDIWSLGNFFIKRI